MRKDSTKVSVYFDQPKSTIYPTTSISPLLLPRRLHRDLHVLTERDQKLEQPPDREIAGAVAHQRRDMRLLDAEHGAGLRLRHPARPSRNQRPAPAAVHVQRKFVSRKVLASSNEACSTSPRFWPLASK